MSDADKEERKAMEKKLEEMEEKLTVIFELFLPALLNSLILEFHCQQCRFSWNWNGKHKHSTFMICQVEETKN